MTRRTTRPHSSRARRDIVTAGELSRSVAAGSRRLGRRRHRRRQRRAGRRAHGAASRPKCAGPRARAAVASRRQLPPYEKCPLRPLRSGRVQHRQLPLRGALRRPLRGRYRPERRVSRPDDGEGSETVPAVDERPRDLLAAAAHRTLHLGRTNRFFLGGGKALDEPLLPDRGEMGITVAYDASAEEFIAEGDSVTGHRRRVAGRREQVRAKAIVCAAGGFEANIDWLARYWGEAARNYIIRGPIYNDGTMLQASTTSARRAPARRRASTPPRSTPARRASTAGSPPASTASPSASWSTVSASASMTRARSCGRSATRSGAATSPSKTARSPTPSGTPR